VLRGERQRQLDLVVRFDPEDPAQIAGFAVLPTLDEGLVVRAPGPQDIAAINALELMSPVQRDDGTTVVIDHNRTNLVRETLVPGHRLLGVFDDGRLLASQAVVPTSTVFAGAQRIVAVNHHSRSHPDHRRSGHLLHLIGRLYLDLWATIDQFVSFVDVGNGTGLRLSFGEPWPRRARRLYLPVDDLVARHRGTTTLLPFDPTRVASLLNQTHGGNALYSPHTERSLNQRVAQAPEVYGRDAWLVGANAAIGVWPSGERRTYRRDDAATTRRLAPVLDDPPTPTDPVHIDPTLF
jgi:hypothetical protein